MNKPASLLILSLFTVLLLLPACVTVKRLEKTNTFKLSYTSVGFGSNMFRMQPAFKLEGKQFIYTSEEVWRSNKKQVLQKDTFCTGLMRQSSIDSILAIVSNLDDTIIKKSDQHWVGGRLISLVITTDCKRIDFELFNAQDSTADKLFDVLKLYMQNTNNVVVD